MSEPLSVPAVASDTIPAAQTTLAKNAADTPEEKSGFQRGLGLFDSTTVVVGGMIGSGIFVVSADMSRLIGSPGWLLAAWLITGILTVSAALETMFPGAGAAVMAGAIM